MARNLVILTGVRLGSNPELRDVGDSKVANFSVAENGGKDKDGNELPTVWHRVVAWDKRAELAGRYLQKGSEVSIQGTIKYESYEKDGETKYVTKIVANNITFHSTKNQSQSSGGDSGGSDGGTKNHGDIPF